MNLAIEYLIRTGVIKEFFAPPSTLCLEHWIGAKMIVGIENSGRSHYTITHWDLETLNEDQRLPQSESFQILREELFINDKIVLPDYFPIPYHGISIDSSYNRYNRPMYEDTYESYLDQLLYSQMHHEIRNQWLWKAFLKLHISRPILPLIYYENDYPRNVVNLEKSVIAEKEHDKWLIWCAWKKKLLRAKGVAPELVFQSPN